MIKRIYLLMLFYILKFSFPSTLRTISF